MSSMKNKLRNTLLAIVTALTVASCTDKKPEMKNYNNFPGSANIRGTEAYFKSDSAGRVYAIGTTNNNVYFAIDTTVAHQLWSDCAGKPVVMNNEMTELATAIRNKQIRLHYLIDSAKYESKHK